MTDDKLIQLAHDMAAEVRDEDFGDRCPVCEGTGSFRGEVCPDCEGAGWEEI